MLNFRFAEDSSIFSIYSKAFVITCITARVKIFLQNIKLNFRLEKIARYFPEREKNWTRSFNMAIRARAKRLSSGR